MRDFKGMKRQRGRNRKPGGNSGNANSANPNRSWDSQGPENIKVRGNAQTVYERYQQLARDAGASGDRVLAENYLQHAEHYFRVLRALQPQRPVSEIAARELSNQGYDIDFEDETGAQAAAFLAAQQAADRAAQGSEPRDSDGGQTRDNTNRDQNQNRNDGGSSQPREWRDRDGNADRDRGQNRDRDRPNRDGAYRDNAGRDGQNRDAQNRDAQNRDSQNRDAPYRETQNRDSQPPAEGELQADGDGGRRETRRERWERRREERNRRFEAEGGQGEAPAHADDGIEPPVAEAAVEAPAAAEDVAPTRARRTRSAPRNTAPRDDADNEAPVGLPGFLTRSSVTSAPAEPASVDGEEAPAPKRRAPRRKAEAPVDEG
jgi:hypothetical protein